jgi:hypothetical protein
MTTIQTEPRPYFFCYGSVYIMREQTDAIAVPKTRWPLVPIVSLKGICKIWPRCAPGHRPATRCGTND